MIYSSKAVSYGLIFFLNFLTGVEYAVILPTALQFLERYGGNQLDLGLCLSAYSFASLFSSPIMGKWSDKTNNTKLIIIFANLWQIAGSFMYFVGLSTNFIITGRLVAGVGLGVVSCTFSDIVKTTPPQERSQILSRIMIGRQLGMILGPAFNFFLLNLNLKMGPFVLDNLSAPGLFMASCWFVLQVLMVLFYKNLHEFLPVDPAPISSGPILSINRDENEIENESRPLLGNDRRQQQKQNNSSYEPSTSRSGYTTIGDDEDEANNEHESLVVNHSQGSKQNSTSLSPRTRYNRIRIVDNSEAGPLVVRFYNEYIREEVVCVLTTTFTVFFMQTALETMLTPYTREYFKWNDMQNSIFYAIAGLDIMIIFFILGFASKKIKDRYLLLIGILGNLSTLIFLIVYLPSQKPCLDAPAFKDYALFMLPVFGNVSSLPLIVLGSISLLSKITNIETQGLTQGIRRTVVGIACIMGPIWSGIFFEQWYILIGSLIGILSLSLIMTLLSFKYLKAPHEA